MKEKIIKQLTEIERGRNIEILLACETGSRAWGFPSPDSDYDVRIIYKHNTDWYLSLSEEKDTIELMLDNNELDITGWDIRKALRLLWKSNPPLLERIQSPIIYKADEEFLKGINEVAKNCYSRIATIHHYLSMGKKQFEEVGNLEEYKLKRLFYALRAATACKWIIEKEEMPPIEFVPMLDAVSVDESLRTQIKELIKLKATKGESYMHKGESEIIEFIKETLDFAEAIALQLPPGKPDKLELNDFFRKTIR